MRESNLNISQLIEQQQINQQEQDNNTQNETLDQTQVVPSAERTILESSNQILRPVSNTIEVPHQIELRENYPSIDSSSSSSPILVHNNAERHLQDPSNQTLGHDPDASIVQRQALDITPILRLQELHAQEPPNQDLGHVSEVSVLHQEIDRFQDNENERQHLPPEGQHQDNSNQLGPVSSSEVVPHQPQQLDQQQQRPPATSYLTKSKIILLEFVILINLVLSSAAVAVVIGAAVFLKKR